MPQSRRAVYRPLWEHILCSSHIKHFLVSHSRPMGSVQLLMTSPASLPSHSTGRPIQWHFRSQYQPYSNNPFNLVSYRRPMGSFQLLMTAAQQAQPTLQPPQPTLPHRFLPSHSTGRPVEYPLWEVTTPSNLMRWPLRSQCRYVDNLRSPTSPKQTIYFGPASDHCRQALLCNESQPTQRMVHST
jgi:hypothetical protein